MGCLQALYLLNQQSQAWKDKFIEMWIPIAGPFGGAAKELKLHASGDAQGLPVDPLKIREEQRSYETNFWLAPVPRYFGSQVLVSTPSRNYTAADFEEFLGDIGYGAVGRQLWRRVANLTSALMPPGVPVTCMYSLGVKTPARFSYGPGGFNLQPQVEEGDGDGTVNDLSLRLCERWAEGNSAAKVVRFSGITHSGMLTDDRVLQSLLKELEDAQPQIVV
ncbi:unnamed protein product [Polarella glacialis]|uniref:Uncharacterized protein n=1 Tax=Polarella glacialis TaxID=89957 RepID=A0A813KNI8_POLGL|nr:unnamed protein product [Polarella glacialis]